MIEDHDRGLDHDLPRLISRRQALGVMLGGVGSAVLVGVRQVVEPSESGARPRSASEIPEETAGPYPGDGSNGPNVLTESGVVRRTSRRASATRPAWPRASRRR